MDALQSDIVITRECVSVGLSVTSSPRPLPSTTDKTSDQSFIALRLSPYYKTVDALQSDVVITREYVSVGLSVISSFRFSIPFLIPSYRFVDTLIMVLIGFILSVLQMSRLSHFYNSLYIK